MDYKELIVRITKCRANCEILRDLETCNDAIKAIETLLEERDAAKEQVQYLQSKLDMYGGDIGIAVAFQKAAERDTAVDAAPVVHGRWLHSMGSPYFSCSACRRNDAIHQTHYCPNCGAKMDLPEKEDAQ